VQVALRRKDHDLEAVEKAVLLAALAAGGAGLGAFMTAVGAAAPEQPLACPRCRGTMLSTGQRGKRVLTLLGEVSYSRARYACPACKKMARYPADELLGISRTFRSPGVQRQVARLGAKETFKEVSEDLKELLNITLSPKDAERIAERIGHDIEREDAKERQHIRKAPPPPPEEEKTIEDLYFEPDGTGVPMVQREQCIRCASGVRRRGVFRMDCRRRSDGAGTGLSLGPRRSVATVGGFGARPAGRAM